MIDFSKKVRKETVETKTNYDIHNLTEDLINNGLEHNLLSDTNVWNAYVES